MSGKFYIHYIFCLKFKISHLPFRKFSSVRWINQLIQFSNRLQRGNIYNNIMNIKFFFIFFLLVLRIWWHRTNCHYYLIHFGYYLGRLVFNFWKSFSWLKFSLLSKLNFIFFVKTVWFIGMLLLIQHTSLFFFHINYSVILHYIALQVWIRIAQSLLQSLSDDLKVESSSSLKMDPQKKFLSTFQKFSVVQWI